MQNRDTEGVNMNLHLVNNQRFFLSFDGINRKWYTNEDTDPEYNTVKIPMQDSAEYSVEFKKYKICYITMLIILKLNNFMIEFSQPQNSFCR